MKRGFIITFIILLFNLNSCIKKEALNREADIISFSLPSDIVLGVNIDDNKIQVTVRKGVDITNLAPTIRVSHGAVIFPKSQDPQDFTNNVTYKVTSEDGNYSRNYTVEINSDINLYFTFEDWIIKDKEAPKLADHLWASGNDGVSLINPTIYPTRPTEECVEGTYAALLETQKGAKIVGKNIPIFAGSLFRGKFDLLNALFDPLTAPQFGQPHPKDAGKPVALTGYYKYKVGSPFIGSDGGEIKDRLDLCTIRGVFFRVQKGKNGIKECLTAKDIMTSDKIVGWADMKDCSQQLSFTKFIIPFEYRAEINYDLYDYKLAIIFSSSKNGDMYEGAIGSQLIIDDVSVICEPFK